MELDSAGLIRIPGGALRQVSAEIAKPADKPDQEQRSFAEMLRSALGEVSRMQREADEAVRKLAAGGDIDIDQVMILTEKANIALQLTIELRNKVLQAYQEIIRMQI